MINYHAQQCFFFLKMFCIFYAPLSLPCSILLKNMIKSLLIQWPFFLIFFWCHLCIKLSSVQKWTQSCVSACSVPSRAPLQSPCLPTDEGLEDAFFAEEALSFAQLEEAEISDLEGAFVQVWSIFVQVCACSGCLLPCAHRAPSEQGWLWGNTACPVKPLCYY